MGLQEILFGVPAAICSSYGEEVILGPILNEGKSTSSSISKHSIEEGVDVTDHVKWNSPSFTIKTMLADQNDLMGAAGNVIKSAVGFKTDSKSVKEKIELLEAWQEMGELLIYSGPVFSGKIIKGFDLVAEDVVIQKINISRSTSTGSGLEVGITLQKVIIVEAMISEIDLPQRNRSRRRKGQRSKKTTTSSAARNRSLLSKIGG